MKYYLSKEQFKKLWDNVTIEYYDPQSNQVVSGIVKRVQKFTLMHPTIKYSEAVQDTGTGYWGILEGSEADITMFLLKF